MFLRKFTTRAIVMISYYASIIPAALAEEEKAEEKQFGVKCNEDLCNPLFKDGKIDLIAFLAGSIKVILGMIGVVAFIVIIAGAARWMTAGGNSDQVDEGRKMIIWAILGLVLVATSFAVLDFFFKGVGTAFYGS